MSPAQLSALVDHRTRTIGPLFTKCPLSGGHVPQVQRTAVVRGGLGATLVGGDWHSRLAGRTVGPATRLGPSVRSSRPAMPCADLLKRRLQARVAVHLTACCQAFPRKALPPSRYARCIYFRVLRTGIGLQVFSPPHPTRLPHMPVPVRQASALHPATFGSRLTSLPLTVPPVGPVEDLQPRDCSPSQ